jgi:hypothetical protein
VVVRQRFTALSCDVAQHNLCSWVAQLMWVFLVSYVEAELQRSQELLVFAIGSHVSHSDSLSSINDSTTAV